MAERYPEAAGTILTGDGFERAGDGYAPRAPAEAPAAADPAAPIRGGLALQLPASGADPATFTAPGAAPVRVRERGARGPAAPVGAALTYARAGGTSYWTAGADGFEEWLDLDDAGDGAVGEWEVVGATLRQDADAVELVGDDGAVVLRVTAPLAYRPGGGTARAWLRAEGQVIALYTDARGPALIDPAWATVRTMVAARRYHTATLLFNGKVLVAGGNTSGTTATATAELYDPSTGSWSSTGSMASARYQHTATLLRDGRVLVTGGTNGTAAVATAELYDPATGAWTSTGPLATARQTHTATLLQSGKVLVAGGAGASALASAELYDPSAGTWSATGPLATSRQKHTATLLTNGKVLAAGGVGGAGGTTVLASAELYDPAAGTWSAAGSLLTARQSHAAVLLPTGRVLFAGGQGTGGNNVLQSAELWNPANQVSTTTGGMAQTHQQFPAVLLPSGLVLVAGGFTNVNNLAATTVTELYNPTTGTWSTSIALGTGRGACTGTILPSGRVLVAGGSDRTNFYATASVYDSTNVGAFSATGALPAGREFHTATLLQSGKVLVAGGSSSGAPVRSVNPLATAALYDPGPGTWSATGSLTGARTFHTATLLPSGKVLAVAGYDGSNPLKTAQLYDPAAGTWTATGALAGTRYWHTATLLPSGKVLVAGGSAAVSPANPQAPTSALGTTELYDPATGLWSSTGSFPSGRTRWGHTATLLQNGKVLVVGGSNGGTDSLQTADLYDPATGTWTATGTPTAARRFHSAVLLADGRVLIIGGLGGTGPAALVTTELYDPARGTFTATAGTLADARYRSQGILLQSGLVLMAGGTSGTAAALDTAQLYDPASDTWSNTSNNMNSRRHGMSFTLLQSGKVLAAGGDTNTTETGTNPPTATCDLYDVGQGPLPASVPSVSSADSNVAGGSIAVTGTLFTGISEASGWGTASSPTNYPLVDLTAAGSNAEIFAPVTTYTPTTLTATLPATAQPGPYLLRVVVNGVRSAAVSMTIYQPLAVAAGATMAPPLGTVAFSATGGSGGYTWSVATNNSGATIDGVGAYRAGATGNVTDVVRVTDSAGNSATASVTVTAGVTISPATVTLAPKASQAFTASGGSGVGFTWSLTTNRSGGGINASGVYTAGATGGVTDVVTVTDPLGNTASRSITVTSGVRISPAGVTLPPRGTQTFSASAGSGSGYVWSFQTNASGGSINATTGAYAAGATPGVVDTVLVTDSLGNTATAPVAVGVGVTISPASASVAPRGRTTFTASGGSGLPYSWSLSANASGGTIDATGSYVAGPTPNVADVVQAVDALGNVATRSVAVGPGVTIAAAPVIPPCGAPPCAVYTFTASGGSGTGWAWSLSTNASGGSIVAATGAYVAGAIGGATDVVRVTDSLGNVATQSVSVGPGVTIATAGIIPPRGPHTFTAAGGSGTGWTWSLSISASGGSIDAATGAYVAGLTGGVTDVVRVTDSRGNVAALDVTVGPNLAIAPGVVSVAPQGNQALTATGGSGLGLRWSLQTNASGGKVDPNTGLYEAGKTGGVTDVVAVEDSLHNTATRSVAVTAGVSISPSSAMVRDGATRAFTAGGGSGTGFTWSLSTNASEGSIGASTGVYQAGANAGVDVILVTDSLGNTATASATVTRLFADLAFDVTSAGNGAMVTATLTVFNDTADAVTVTPPGYDELTLTNLAPAAWAIDPSAVDVAAGSRVQFKYALQVSGPLGASYVAAAQAKGKVGGLEVPINLATTPAGTIAEVRVDWTPAALVPSRNVAPYRFSLVVKNDGAFPVTRVEIDNPQPGSFTGLAADPTTCTSADLPAVTLGSDSLAFSGSLEKSASTTLCFAFTGVPAVTVKTSYSFTVTVTRSGGFPLTVSYDRAVRLDVAPPDVAMPSVLSDAGGQTLTWANTGGADAPHDGVVVFRALAPAVPTIPADYVDYRVLSSKDLPHDFLFADAGYSTVEAYDDASVVGIYNYRICNHDADFVYSACNSGFWNKHGWLDSAVAPPGGWTQQLGGAIYTLPGVLPGLSVSIATNAPAVATLSIATGARSAVPLALPGLPPRNTPVAPLGSGRTLLFAADEGGTVTAMDVTTGTLAWQVAEAGEAFVAGITGTLRQYAAPAFQATYSGDVLFIGSTSGRLLALDADTGATLWTVDAGAPIRATARYDATNNWLYVPTSGGGVVAYDLGTPSATTPPLRPAGWVNPGGNFQLGCARGNATTELACIDARGLVVVLDRSSGAVKASRATGLESPSTLWMVQAPRPGYVVSNASAVQRLELSGATLSLAGSWAPAGITLSPVQVFAADGTIYAGGSDAKLHKLVLASVTDTGQVAAVEAESGAVQLGPPAYDVVKDLFLFGTDDGRLWAVKKF